MVFDGFGQFFIRIGKIDIDLYDLAGDSEVAIAFRMDAHYDSAALERNSRIGRNRFVIGQRESYLQCLATFYLLRRYEEKAFAGDIFGDAGENGRWILAIEVEGES